jgi:hypothetical protein
VGDLRQLIAHQLRGRVDPPSDLDRAVDVMQEKAEGAFVYIARAFDDLDNQERQMWTVQQLGDMLPKVGTVLRTVTCLTCPRHAPDINAPSPHPIRGTPHTPCVVPSPLRTGPSRDFPHLLRQSVAQHGPPGRVGGEAGPTEAAAGPPGRVVRAPHTRPTHFMDGARRGPLPPPGSLPHL